MSSALTGALSYTLIAAVAALVGGIIAIYYAPGPYGQSYVQHFSAGVVFAAVAAKLLPDIHDEAPLFVIVGFTLGVATMLGVHQLSHRIDHGGFGSGFDGAASLLITVCINMVIDGVLIGVAFLAEPRTALIIALALAVETLFITIAGVSALPAESSPLEKLAVPVAFGSLLLVGVTVGILGFASAGQTSITIILAFGAANLIYLVTEELLVKAQKVPETPTSTTLFFLGFLLVFVFDMLY